MAAAASGQPNMVPNNVVKSGWMWRQTQVLRRWKKAWFCLYASGRFMYYEDQMSGKADDFIHVPAQRAIVMNPQQCSNIRPPDGKNAAQVFGVRTGEKTWYLCAEDADDAMAWQLSLEEAVNIRPQMPQQPNATGSVPPGMQAYYPGQGYSNYNQLPPGTAVYMTQDGPILVDQYGNRIVIAHDCCRGRRYGMGGGFLAGAAVGSLMLWPWMMFPLFWW